MASILARVVLGACLAVATVIAGGGVRDAAAQPKPAPSAADKAKASRLVDEANAALDAKDYDKSIELNQKANALVPHPIFLFNMAQAHRLAKRRAEAAALYDQYLAQAPTGDQAAAARAWLDEMKDEAAKEAAAKEAAEKEVAARAAATASSPPGPSDPRTAGGAQPLPERTDTVSQPGRSMRITGLVLGGVGLASIAFGAYNTSQVMKYRREGADELKRNTVGVTGAEYDMVYEFVYDKYDTKSEPYMTPQYVGYIVGGALVVGGAVTYWLGHRQGAAAEATAWTPVVGPGYTGVALSGAFF